MTDPWGWHDDHKCGADFADVKSSVLPWGNALKGAKKQENNLIFFEKGPKQSFRLLTRSDAQDAIAQLNSFLRELAKPSPLPERAEACYKKIQSLRNRISNLDFNKDTEHYLKVCSEYEAVSQNPLNPKRRLSPLPHIFEQAQQGIITPLSGRSAWVAEWGTLGLPPLSLLHVGRMVWAFEKAPELDPVPLPKRVSEGVTEYFITDKKAVMF